ncbi:MAG: 3-hydroxyacyl-CoA dehydrogenase NAD-binding domain-containing protein [Myxococcota bacterium]
MYSIDIDSDGIATLTLAMEGRANKINGEFIEGLGRAWDEIEANADIKGVILTSAHNDFCVGADLEMVYRERDAARLIEGIAVFHRLHRRMEQGVPLVAALNGSALGGGYEMALVCNHRIGVPSIKVGLPEVSLGLIPGGGGTQRLPRLIGIQPALEVISQGQILRADKALAKGLINEIVEPEKLLAHSKAWLLDNLKAQQPWDASRFRWPSPRPNTEEARNLFLVASAMAYKKTAGAFKAVEHAISAVQEGSVLALDPALQVEMRHFAKLVVSDQSKDMVRTLFFFKQRADRQIGLPKTEAHEFTKVSVLGAGMMGAGIGFLCAKAGLQVVLKDVNGEAVEAGMKHVQAQVARMKWLSEGERAVLLGRVTGTIDVADCAGSDLIIEAVPENKGIKAAVTKETEPLLAEGAVWASNTSALPISELAQASAHPERFIGLHFFSPVEKMPLLEIITGEKTDEATLGRCLALGKALGKTCIVVNDGYGFYTSRTFSSYILEGAELVAEGHDPSLIEWAARSAGMPVGPLQVFDEVTLSLGHKGLIQGAEYRGAELLEMPGVKMLFRMVEAGRGGRSAGAGFYRYEGGRRKGIWEGLSDLVHATPDETGLDIVQQRLLLAQVAEVGRCLDDGVLRDPADAEVGGVFGIGFAPNRGGPLAYADRVGLPELVTQLKALAAQHGPRFAPSETFKRMAAENQTFFGSFLAA